MSVNMLNYNVCTFLTVVYNCMKHDMTKIIQTSPSLVNKVDNHPDVTQSSE